MTEEKRLELERKTLKELEDLDPIVRSNACYKAYSLDLVLPSSMIFNLFTDESPRVRRYAVTYLCKSSNITNYMVIQLLLDPVESVRKTAMEAFASRIDEVRSWVLNWIDT